MTRIALAACGNVTATPSDAPSVDARAGALTVQVSTIGNDLDDGITQPVKTLKRGIGLDIDGNAGARLITAVGNTWNANVQGADAVHSSWSLQR